MDESWVGRAEAWFHEYVNRFREDGTLSPMHESKYVHSLKVADEAEGIAAESDWSAGDVRTARAAGLLHDVGRFSQVAEFGTFVDVRSVDHGRRGVEVLTAEGVCDDWPSDDRRAVLDAVLLHNRKTIPESLNGRPLAMTKLVRDADKLDIFRVVREAVETGRDRRHRELLALPDPDAGLNDDLLNLIRAGRQGSHAEIRSFVDLMVLKLAWVFDINYPAAMARIFDRGHLEWVRQRLPDDPNVEEAYAIARAARDDALSGAAEEA